MKMSLKKAIIHVEKADAENRRRVNAIVSRVIATYPDFILAEVDEKQIDSLEKLKIKLEVQESAPKIKLRTVEFDASKIPSPPLALKLTTAEVKREKTNYWIVQFVGPIKAEWRERILRLGTTLHGYIPENAFIVFMDAKTKEKVESLKFVNWIGLYEPAYKVSHLLMGKKEKVPVEEFGALTFATEKFKPKLEGNLNIVLHASADLKKVSQEIEKLGGTIIASGRDKIRVSLDLSNLDKIAKIVDVKWIEPYVLPELCNDVAAQIMGVQPAWNRHGLDGEGQIVAIADTGLDTGVNDATMHDDFKGRIVSIYSWPINATFAQTYCDNTTLDDGAADLESGHGTHVGGSVLGSGAKSGGAIRGIAFRARLVFQAVQQWTIWKQTYKNSPYNYTDGYTLSGIPLNLNDLFQQAYNDYARIQTNSWGSHRDASGNLAYGQYLSSSREIDEFLWNHKDMIILFAAGNEGRDTDRDGVVDNDSLTVEATAKNCITVGASENNRPHGSTPPPGLDINWGTGSWAAYFPTPPISTDHISNNPEGMAAFSSRGPTDDGRIKPDVVAPGTNILSVRSSQCGGHGWGLLPTTDPNEPYYMYFGGTSMATPLVAGTAALIRQYIQNLWLHHPSGALLKAMLIHGAVRLRGQYTSFEVGDVPEKSQGWGRVDLNLLFPGGSYELTTFWDNPHDALVTGDHRNHSFRLVNSAFPLRTTLVWTDSPSQEEAGGGLVNTLLLKVISPNGTTVLGAPSNNNVQQVIIRNPQPGNYTVRIEGTNVATAEKQAFSVVISGRLNYVDLFIRDGPTDAGLRPLAVREYNSPDIEDKLISEPDPRYVKIRVLVKVNNRGTVDVKKAEVSLFWGIANRNSNNQLEILERGWSKGWTKVGTQYLDIPGVGNTLAVYMRTARTSFEFRISKRKIADIRRHHRALMLIAMVNHKADPTMPDKRLMRWENNIAAKAAAII